MKWDLPQLRAALASAHGNPAEQRTSPSLPSTPPPVPKSLWLQNVILHPEFVNLIMFGGPTPKSNSGIVVDKLSVIRQEFCLGNALTSRTQRQKLKGVFLLGQSLLKGPSETCSQSLSGHILGFLCRKETRERERGRERRWKGECSLA